MRNLRVIDGSGNKRDYEVDFIPRIGERIVLEFGRDGEPSKAHYFRVQDVMYHLDNSPANQVAVLVVEDDEAKLWHQ